MRSYHHYCGLARALDVVGERWTLLIVRELLNGPRGYNQLLDGLPGIATNLLADRLRSLDQTGIASRLDNGLYELTPWGLALRDTIYALGRWAGPLMAKPRSEDHFQTPWLHHMVIARFDGHDPERRDLTVELSTNDDVFTLVSKNGRVHLTPGRTSTPDVILSGPTEPVVGLLLSRITATQAKSSGVTTRGATRLLNRLRPRGERRAEVPAETRIDNRPPRGAAIARGGDRIGSSADVQPVRER